MPQTALKREFPRFRHQSGAFISAPSSIAERWRLIKSGAFGRMGIFRTATWRATWTGNYFATDSEIEQAR
jgi:hypothetical protein